MHMLYSTVCQCIYMHVCAYLCSAPYMTFQFAIRQKRAQQVQSEREEGNGIQYTVWYIQNSITYWIISIE